MSSPSGSRLPGPQRHGPRRPRCGLRLLGGAAARRPVRAAGRALPRGRVPDGRPRGQDRDADQDRQPAGGWGRSPRQRGGGLRAGRAAPASSSTSAPASTIDAVSADGEYLGGAIAPGLEVSLTALVERAARITRIDLAEPDAAIGRSSRAAIQSGFVFGFAGLIDGIARRIEEELGEARCSATGGLADGDRSLHRDDRRGRRPAYSQGPASHI